MFFELKDGKKDGLYNLLKLNPQRTTAEVLEKVIWRCESANCKGK